MKCRKMYKDEEKYRKYRNGCNARYYKRSRNATNRYKKWDEAETDMILNKQKTDRELAELLGRSVMAIQVKRNKVLGEMRYGQVIQE